MTGTVAYIAVFTNVVYCCDQIGMWWNKTAKRLYLDYAAATPVHSEVLEAMRPYFTEWFGNASAIHAEGVAASEALESARLELARTLGVRQPEVIFTGSGTESNNLALYGHVRALREIAGRASTDIEIIATAIEHPSILEVLRDLEQQGVVVKYVPVDEAGRVDEKALLALLSPQTALVTFAYANSEIGTVQDVKRLTRCIRKFNTEHGTKIRTHLDASQAPLWLPCQVPPLGVDMMTLDAGKCEGPKGVGVLVVRGGVPLCGFVRGGGQEQALRAGTENTPLIVGAATAIVRAQKHHQENATRVAGQRDLLAAALSSSLSNVVVNGATGERRIANNLNISLPGLDTEYAVVVLDSKGVAASTKSACSGAGGGQSTVLMETTGDAARAASTIRFSLGPLTDLTPANIDLITTTLRDLQNQMQRFDSSGK